MTPPPDKIESEWREWYARTYGVWPTDPPVFDPYSERARTAYHAAASRRDGLSAVERAVVEKAEAYRDAHKFPAMNYGDRNHTEVCELFESVEALRAARAPKPVDPLRAALDLLHGPATHDKLAQARGLLEQALADREAVK